MAEEINNSINKNPLQLIDRNSFEPAYLQLVCLFKQQIASGMLRAGDRLPSESQIVKRYQVSPMTVRRAVNILADQGLVDTAQGRGTFVKPIKLEAATFQLKALQDMFYNEKTSVSIHEARIIKADLRVCQKLKLSGKADRVIYIRRLLKNDKQPLIYHREYLIYDPQRALIESELEVTSLRGLFRGEKGGDFKYGELSLEATLVNRQESKELSVAAGSPAFNIEHIFYDYSDTPVSWGWFICPSDHLRFTTTIGVTTRED